MGHNDIQLFFSGKTCLTVLDVKIPGQQGRSSKMDGKMFKFRKINIHIDTLSK